MSRSFHREPPPAGAREIPGFEGLYFATPDGQIWPHFSQKFLVQSPSSTGYLVVTPRIDGQSLTIAVHRLVCAAFHGPAPCEDMEVNHDDLVKTNNTAANLEWMTPQQNSEHAWTNLPRETTDRMRLRVSEAAKVNGHKHRKLSPEQVVSARSMLAAGRRRSEAAAALGVCTGTIRNLDLGVHYRD